MIIPKFAYNPGAGIIDFVPAWPPTDKPPFSLSAIRHDSIASAGDKDSLLERIDEFVPLNFATVPATDISSWRAFFSYALAGSVFTYFPDSTDESTWSDYTLEDMAIEPKRTAPGYYSLSFKMRLYAGEDTPPYFS